MQQKEQVKKVHKDLQDILITEQQIADKVHALGEQICIDYKHSDNLLLIGILKGSVTFLADLMRSISLPVEIDFLSASSYGNSTQSSNSVKILKYPDAPLAGRDILLVEDILDTGKTLHVLVPMLQEQCPRSIRTVTLLDKPDRRVVDFRPDYVGFTVPDQFLVGYGMDYAEQYRNLPYIGILRRSVYEK